MFTPEQIEAMPSELEQTMRGMGRAVMLDLVRRLKRNSGDITAAAAYVMNRAYELGAGRTEIRKIITGVLEVSGKSVDKVYSETIKNGYALDEALYKASGREFIPFKENDALQQLIEAVKAQTKSEMKNITQSMGFAVKKDGKTEFTGLADYYQQTLDSATMEVASGIMDYNTALNRVVSEMTNSGLRAVDYASGRTTRIDAAARRALLTGVNQVTARITEKNMDILQTEHVEVSWHSGARPSHQKWQGKVYRWNRIK